MSDLYEKARQARLARETREAAEAEANRPRISTRPGFWLEPSAVELQTANELYAEFRRLDPMVRYHLRDLGTGLFGSGRLFNLFNAYDFPEWFPKRYKIWDLFELAELYVATKSTGGPSRGSRGWELGSPLMKRGVFVVELRREPSYLFRLSMGHSFDSPSLYTKSTSEAELKESLNWFLQYAR